MAVKKRLDQLVQERHPHLSRTIIQSFITQGKVMVNGVVVTKPGSQVTDDAQIVLAIEEPKYVSRAGFKLEKALSHFNLDVHNFVVLDAGLSTGGFTDLLLKSGAAKIYGVDVGYGQVHEKIRNDPRVIVMERTNLRTLNALPEQVDLVTLDLSFISILKVMDTITKILKEGGHLIALIKPQFEARREQVGKGGIIKDSRVHQEVLDRVIQGITEHGFTLVGWIESPIEGATGNKEFLAYFRKRGV